MAMVTKDGTGMPEDIPQDSLYMCRVFLLLSVPENILTQFSPLYRNRTWKAHLYRVRLVIFKRSQKIFRAAK